MWLTLLPHVAYLIVAVVLSVLGVAVLVSAFRRPPGRMAERRLALRNQLGALAAEASAHAGLCVMPPADPPSGQAQLDQEWIRSYLDWSSRVADLLLKASGEAAVHLFNSSANSRWHPRQPEMTASRFEDGAKRVTKLIRQLDKGRLSMRSDWEP